MCFTETQWKEGTKPLCQTPLKNGKAALQGPGPWRSRMSLRKRQRRQVFPTAPAQGRQGVTTVTYLLPPLLTVTCFLDAFGGLFLLVNTQTALLAARIPFERKCFPNDRALPKKTQKNRGRERETKPEKMEKHKNSHRCLGKEKTQWMVTEVPQEVFQRKPVRWVDFVTRTFVTSQVEQFTARASVSRIHMLMQLRCNFYLSQPGAESNNYRALSPALRPTTEDQANVSFPNGWIWMLWI